MTAKTVLFILCVAKVFQWAAKYFHAPTNNKLTIV